VFYAPQAAALFSIRTHLWLGDVAYLLKQPVVLVAQGLRGKLQRCAFTVLATVAVLHKIDSTDSANKFLAEAR
jgi:hypothetical protein